MNSFDCASITRCAACVLVCGVCVRVRVCAVCVCVCVHVNGVCVVCLCVCRCVYHCVCACVQCMCAFGLCFCLCVVRPPYPLCVVSAATKRLFADVIPALASEINDTPPVGTRSLVCVCVCVCVCWFGSCLMCRSMGMYVCMCM